MHKLKQIWKYQLYLSIALIVLVAISAVVNQMTTQGDVITAAKHSYALTFIVANSQKTFQDIASLFLTLFLVKDLLFLAFVSMITIGYVFLFRSIVKHTFGYVKLFFVGLFLLLLYGEVIGNIYITQQMGIKTTAVFVEHALFIIILLLMTVLYGWFCFLYYQYRKAHHIGLFSRASFLQIAYKTIKNTTVVLIALLMAIILLLVFASQLSLYLIHQLALENYLSSLYHFDTMQLFQNTPAVMQQFLLGLEKEDWFYTIQKGVVVVDVHSIDTRIQAQLSSLIRTNAKQFIDTTLKTMLFYIGLNGLNFIYKRRNFTIFEIAYGLFGLMIVKVVFLQARFALFQMCDIIFVIATFIYFVDAFDRQFLNGQLYSKTVLFWKEKALGYIKVQSDRTKTKLVQTKKYLGNYKVKSVLKRQGTPKRMKRRVQATRRGVHKKGHARSNRRKRSMS